MNQEHIKTVLTNVAMRWLHEADQYNKAANPEEAAGCESEIRDALSDLCREHAQALEQIIKSLP